jgi:hypothetical protein
LGDPTTRKTYLLDKDWIFKDSNWAFSSNSEKVSNGLEWMEFTGIGILSKEKEMILRGKLSFFCQKRELVDEHWMTTNSEKYVVIPKDHYLFTPFKKNIHLLKSLYGKSFWLSLSPRWRDDKLSENHPLLKFYLTHLN